MKTEEQKEYSMYGAYDIRVDNFNIPHILENKYKWNKLPCVHVEHMHDSPSL